jgi:hypothetical protein
MPKPWDASSVGLAEPGSGVFAFQAPRLPGKYPIAYQPESAVVTERCRRVSTAGMLLPSPRYPSCTAFTIRSATAWGGRLPVSITSRAKE